MSVYLKLVDLYRRNGFQVRTGLYPPHFGNFKGASGTVLEKDSMKLRTGGGIALGEVYLLEELCAVVGPKRVFIIGNAFGWSTFAFAYACPEARVVALDAFYVCGMLLLVTLGMRTGSSLYFEASIIIALLGFSSTVALAKFLMRGEIVE